MNNKRKVRTNIEKFLEEPLRGVSWAPVFVKKESAENLQVDETENIVVTSARYASSSRRLIQKSGENCDISIEENEEVVHDELNNTTEESTHFTVFDTQTQELSSQENNLFSNRLKCNTREKEFQKFICSSCPESFTSKYKLIMHVFIHIDGVQPPLYVCKSCGEVFPNNVNLIKHLEISESDQNLCTDNNKKFNSRDQHKNGIFLEGDVEVSFIEQTERKSSSQKTCVVSKKFLSGICNTHTISHSVEKVHTGDNYVTSPASVNSTEDCVPLTTERPHKCNFCGRPFLRLSHLRSHVLLHVGRRPHKCEVCGKTFARSSHLKLHALTHTGTKPHRCDFCGRSFAQLGSLKSHVLLHTGNRPYKCDTCGKSFVQVGSFKSHILLHTGITPYKCEICKKSFVELRRLKNHMFIHTGLRKYNCDICGKSYTHLSTLKYHASSHTEKERHKCEICGDSFAQLRHLKTHILKHTGTKYYNCDICGKPFTFLGSLKNHALIHTGIKPHKCDVCGKSFTQLGNLKHHVALHTGKRPYKCEICNKQFPMLFYLKRHTLKYHK